MRSLRARRLRLLYRRRDVDATRALFDKLVRHRVAHVSHFNYMLDTCVRGSGDMRKMLTTMMAEQQQQGGEKESGEKTKSKTKSKTNTATKTAPTDKDGNTGVLARAEPTTPNRATFRRVLAELMLEGDLAGVRSIMDEDMPECGVEPDAGIWAQLEVSDRTLNRKRSYRLQMLFHEGDAGAMRRLLDTLVAHGAATAHHFTIMLKTCPDSAKMREGIAEQERIARGGDRRGGVGPAVPAKQLRCLPDTVTYTMLAAQLMLEGDVAGAHAVLDKDMREAGLTPDAHARATLDKPYDTLARMRTECLNTRVRRGDVAGAHALLHALMGHGAVEPHHLNVMLNACLTSDEMREMIDVDMVQIGMRPTEATFGTLASRLMLEGDAAGARAVIAEEMLAAASSEPHSLRDAGIKHGSRVLQCSENELHGMRSQRMRQLSAHGNVHGMRLFLDKLILHGVAAGPRGDSARLFMPMLKACWSSEEIREVMRVDMVEGAGLAPRHLAAAYFCLVDWLVAEGDVAAAKEVVRVEMREEGGLSPGFWLRPLLDRSLDDDVAGGVMKRKHSRAWRSRQAAT